MIALLLALGCSTPEPPVPPPPPVDVHPFPDLVWRAAEDVETWPGSAKWISAESARQPILVAIHPAGDWAFVQRQQTSELWHLETGRYAELPRGRGWFLDRTLRLQTTHGHLDVPLSLDVSSGTWSLREGAGLTASWTGEVVVLSGRSEPVALDPETGAFLGTVAPSDVPAEVAAVPERTGRYAYIRTSQSLEDRTGETLVRSKLRGAPAHLRGPTWGPDGERIAGHGHSWVGVWTAPGGKRTFAMQTGGYVRGLALGREHVVWVEGGGDLQMRAFRLDDRELAWECPVENGALVLGPGDQPLIMSTDRVTRIDPETCSALWRLEATRVPPKPELAEVPEPLHPVLPRYRTHAISWTSDLTRAIWVGGDRVLVWDPTVPPAVESEPPPPPVPGRSRGVGVAAPAGSARRPPRPPASRHRGQVGTDHLDWLMQQ